MQPNQPQQDFGSQNFGPAPSQQPMQGQPVPSQPMQPNMNPQMPNGGVPGGYPNPNGQYPVSKKSKTSLIIVIVVAAVVLVGGIIALILLMNGGNNNNGGSNNNDNNISLPGNNDDEEDEEEDKDCIEFGSECLEEGVTMDVVLSDVFEDTAMGHKFSLKSAVLNIPFNESYSSAYLWKGVAVEVEIQNNTEYDFGGSVSTSNFVLAIGGKRCSAYAANFSDYVESEDLAELPYSVRKGETQRGWIFYYCDRDETGDVVLTYTRSEVKDNTNDTTLPEFKVEATIK